MWNKNKDDARFCANCGAKLVVPPSTAKTARQLYTEPQNETKSTKSCRKIIIKELDHYSGMCNRRYSCSICISVF